jgi:L-iditol 2-dehydrogenase
MMQAAVADGARVVGLDLMERRLALARRLGAEAALDPSSEDVEGFVGRMTDGRGVDLAILATADPRAVLSAQKLVRRGGRVLLFAQTVPGELISVDASRICMEEKQLIGSYSASVELQNKAAELVFSRKIDVARLISHRFAMERLAEGLALAARPTGESLKVVILP